MRVAEEGDIDLNVIVNEEAEQYEKATRVQGGIDNTNESNSGLVKDMMSKLEKRTRRKTQETLCIG